MILIVKEESVEKLTWFDRLCHGLLSWSNFHQKIEKKENDRNLYLFSPSHSKLKWGAAQREIA